MKCPRCGSEDVVRTVDHERAGYVAALLCESCERQVCVIRDEPGEAIDEAMRLFLEGAGAHG